MPHSRHAENMKTDCGWVILGDDASPDKGRPLLGALSPRVSLTRTSLRTRDCCHGAHESTQSSLGQGLRQCGGGRRRRAAPRPAPPSPAPSPTRPPTPNTVPCRPSPPPPPPPPPAT